jgi:hypothetical protein
VAKAVQSPVQDVATTAATGVDDVAAVGNAAVDNVPVVSDVVSAANDMPLVSAVLPRAESVVSAGGAGGRENAAAIPDLPAALSDDITSVLTEAGTVDPAANVVAAAQPVAAAGDVGIAAPEGIAGTVAPLAETVQSVAEDLAASPGVAADLLMSAGEVGAGSVAAVADAVVSEDFLLMSGGVGVALGIAGYAARAAGLGSSAPILFTSFRLIPCYAAETVQHYLSSAAARTANLVGRGDVTRSAAGHATGTTASDVTDATAGEVTEANGAKPNGLLATADGLGQAFRDGFSRGAGGLTDGDGEAARDSRLMMQIGMLLGMVYLGFLTIWFWATRLRPHPGS